MRGDQWNEERVKLLQKLWAGGATAHSIADRLGGISRSAVLGKIFRLRLGAAGAAPVSAAPGDAAPRDSLASGRPGKLGAAGVTAVPAVLLPTPARRRGSKRKNLSQDSRATARTRGKSLLELTNDCCRWPHGRPGTRSFFFCGAPGADLEHGVPYCARHARRAYVTNQSFVEHAPPLAPSAGRSRLVSSRKDDLAIIFRSESRGQNLAHRGGR
jgi:GcrA cell cycle regulator